MTSIRIIEFVKKQCFTVVKWTFFIYFFSLLMSFNYGSIFFRPSKLKSSLEHHNFVFLVVLFSPLELRGTFCVLYQRSLEEGIIYCVSPGIFDVMLFFIGNSQCFLHFLKFSECCESAVFLGFYTKPLVQDISTTLEGTNLTNSNVIQMQQYTIVEE